MKTSASLCILVAPALWLNAETFNIPNIPQDPGVRSGPGAAGGPLLGLSSMELAFFNSGSLQFQRIDSVRGNEGFAGTDNGLGPAFNLDSCGGCHAQPVVGGSSPKINPQVSMASKAPQIPAQSPF
jgi:hypothetical protein